MTRPSTDHVAGVLREVHCDHCAASFETGLMPLPRLVDMLRGFLLMHRLCPKPEAPSRQMALPGTSADPAAPWIPYEPPEATFKGIDGSTDEPAPEIDPPGPYARFEEMYPAATDYPSLYEALKSALSDEQWRSLRRFDQWQPASDTFRSVANWARIEKAHADAYAAAQRGEPGMSGLTIPRREPMPEKLAELLGVKPKQKKGARPLTSPKRTRKADT